MGNEGTGIHRRTVSMRKAGPLSVPSSHPPALWEGRSSFLPPAQEAGLTGRCRCLCKVLEKVSCPCFAQPACLSVPSYSMLQHATVTPKPATHPQRTPECPTPKPACLSLPVLHVCLRQTCLMSWRVSATQAHSKRHVKEN